MTKKEILNKYGFNNYKPNKNCKSVVYEGVTYASKIQCVMLNSKVITGKDDLTMKALNEYLNK